MKFPLSMLVLSLSSLAACGGGKSSPEGAGGDAGGQSSGGAAGMEAGGAGGGAAGSEMNATGGASSTIGGTPGSGGTPSTTGGMGGTNPATGGVGGITGGSGGSSETGAPLGDPTKPWNILFVGNSLSFNSNLKGNVRALVNRGQQEIKIDKSEHIVGWNRGQYYHYWAGFNMADALGCSNTPTNRHNCPTTREHIQSNNFTHVVLQEYVTNPKSTSLPDFGRNNGGTLDKPYFSPSPAAEADLGGSYSVAVATDYLKRMIDEVRKYNKIPIVWAAWPERDLPNRSAEWETLLLAFKKIADDNKAVFVPASGAWRLAVEARPQLNFYVDGIHPSLEGSVLAAYVFYAVLTGKSPVGMVYEPVGGLFDAETKRFMQEKAWEAVQRYGSPVKRN
jgi:hypothetical protein